MIGIDIIDLKDPLLKSREKSFRFILHPDDDYPANEKLAFWLLWTAKEAVFKSKREIKPFEPKLIQITLFRSGNKILFTSGETSGEIFMDDESVIAIAQSVNNTVSYQVREKKTEDESEEVRSCVKKFFSEEKSITIKVSKDTNGLPLLDYRKIPISISHHGRFLSFAYPSFS